MYIENNNAVKTNLNIYDYQQLESLISKLYPIRIHSFLALL